MQNNLSFFFDKFKQSWRLAPKEFISCRAEIQSESWKQQRTQINPKDTFSLENHYTVWVELSSSLAAGYPADRKVPRSDVQSVHGGLAGRKLFNAVLPLFLIILAHYWEILHRSFECTKTTETECVYMSVHVESLFFCASVHILFDPLLKNFYAFSHMCVWHLHARMTGLPAVMKISPVSCHVSNTFISCL